MAPVRCRMSLAVQHGFMMVEEAMEIARQTAAQIVRAMPSPAPPRSSCGDGLPLPECKPSATWQEECEMYSVHVELANPIGGGWWIRERRCLPFFVAPQRAWLGMMGTCTQRQARAYCVCDMSDYTSWRMYVICVPGVSEAGARSW
eukprot:scaffold35296_cov21-Tisochrysis_lutea.AAC.1